MAELARTKQMKIWAKINEKKLHQLIMSKYKYKAVNSNSNNTSVNF
jgi:hypothetical protein